MAKTIAGDGGRPDVSQLTVQPFVTYTLDDGWYLVSAPVITAFWNISQGEKWLIPIGGGIGKVVKIGDRPFNISLQAYWQPIRPANSDGGMGFSRSVPIPVTTVVVPIIG